MTRVLLIHEFPGGFGGAERYLELLAEGLVGLEHDVHTLLFGADVAEGSTVAERIDGGRETTELVIGRARSGGVRAAVRRLEPEVLHWNFVDPFAFRGATITALAWGRPSVITDHLPMRRDGLHYEVSRRLANRRIGAMIVVGEASAAAARAHWRAPPSLHVVRNGVPATGGSVRTQADDRPLRLLYVGRLTDQKGCLDLPDIVWAVRATGRSASLTLVGDGPLRDHVEEALGGSDVELVGFVPDPGPYLADADVLLAPSRYEGLPFTPLEARAAGLPAVLSDIDAHRELEVDQAVELAPVGEPLAWAAAVERVAERLPSASRAALDAAHRHPLEAMVAGTAEVYRSVVG